jgi:hypothetical protein
MRQQLKTIDLSLVRVRALASNAVRITHASPADDDWPPDPPWLGEVLIAPARLRPEEAALVVDSSDADFVQVQTRAGETVFAEFGRARRSPAGSISLTLLIAPEENFYVWGAWFKMLEHTDLHLDLRASEPPSLQEETQPPVPCLISSRGYGFCLLNRRASDWRIDRERCVIEIEAAGGHADYIVIYGPAQQNVLATCTALTGRPPLPLAPLETCPVSGEPAVCPRPDRFFSRKTKDRSQGAAFCSRRSNLPKNGG